MEESNMTEVVCNLKRNLRRFYEEDKRTKNLLRC